MTSSEWQPSVFLSGDIAEKIRYPADQYFKCGRLKDKCGLSWQIVPTVLPKLMADPSGRVMWVALGLRQPAIFALATGKSFSGESRARF